MSLLISRVLCSPYEAKTSPVGFVVPPVSLVMMLITPPKAEPQEEGDHTLAARQSENPLQGGARFFGGPAFVNFGKDNAGAGDGYVYAVSGEQFDNGSELRLGRVPVDGILDAAAWEWVVELREGAQPRWTSRLDEAVPILADDRHISLPEMVYLPGIDRVVFCTFGQRSRDAYVAALEAAEA